MAFAADGAWVLAVDRNRDMLEETCLLAASAPGEICAMACDLLEGDCGQRVVDACVALGGRLDHLINNVGQGGSPPLHLTPDDRLAYFLEVNFMVAFRLCRAAIPIMRRAGGGTIVNIASGVALRGSVPGNTAYVAAKSAVIGMSRQMAAEYGRDGIRVNVVAPGIVPTPANAERIAGGAFQGDIDAIPLGHVGRPEDVANAVVFLAGPKSAFITGEVLAVDGGWSATKYNVNTHPPYRDA